MQAFLPCYLLFRFLMKFRKAPTSNLYLLNPTQKILVSLFEIRRNEKETQMLNCAENFGNSYNFNTILYWQKSEFWSLMNSYKLEIDFLLYRWGLMGKHEDTDIRFWRVWGPKHTSYLSYWDFGQNIRWILIKDASIWPWKILGRFLFFFDEVYTKNKAYLNSFKISNVFRNNEPRVKSINAVYSFHPHL